MSNGEVFKGMGNALLCAKYEIPAILERLEGQKKRILRDFAVFFRGEVDVVFNPVKNETGWSVEATLTLGGEPVRHYDLADNCLLDLNEMMLERMCKKTDAE